LVLGTLFDLLYKPRIIDDEDDDDDDDEYWRALARETDVR
jgi:hypothetical protein